jgi:S1-C subfamily serine protease
VVDRDRDEWRRPWPAPDATAGRVVSADDAVGTASTVRPRALAPPASWDVSQAGPGSPAGSVRPPDTLGTTEVPAEDRRRRGGLFVTLLAALIGAVVGTAGTLLVTDTSDTGAVEATPVTGEPPVNAPSIDVSGDFEEFVPAVARAVTPSVVRIDIIGSGAGGAEAPLGLGSGVIYRSDGYILTNNHVVEGASSLEVKLASGESFQAEVIGTDPLNDLAVLKVDATGLPAVNVRMDDQPQVGESAIAIGSPFGLDASVTAGVVSAVGRDLTVPDPGTNTGVVIPAVIQTDAAINPGNSGGALVDKQGRLLGINSAILTTTGGSQGVGFAIPVGQAVTSAEQLIEFGEVRHAFLGVGGGDVTPEIAEQFDLDSDTGAILESVEPGSGAAVAGLRSGDIVVEVEGEAVESMLDLAVAIRRFQAGDTVEVVYLREGQRREAQVELGERPEAG